MSAWIVSKNHIDRIVATAGTWGFVKGSPDEFGRVLWVENLNSVTYRYPQYASGERPGSIDLADEDIHNYRFAIDGAPPLTPNEMLKAVGCLDYQSCEHPGWEGSLARRICDQLYAAAQERGADHDSREYDLAPWGID